MATRSTQVRILGAVLSFIVPGVGQVVQGRPRAAAVFFVGALVVYTVVFGVAMFVEDYGPAWWMQALGIGWNVAAGVEALLHVRAAPGA